MTQPTIRTNQHDQLRTDLCAVLVCADKLSLLVPHARGGGELVEEGERVGPNQVVPLITVMSCDVGVLMLFVYGGRKDRSEMMAIMFKAV